MQGTAADHLTPEFRASRISCKSAEWNPPFPYGGKLIQKRDEEFWRQYLATPKAYVTLATGQRLWGQSVRQLHVDPVCRHVRERLCKCFQ